MTSISNQSGIVQEFVKSLGLDPKKIYKLTLTIAVGHTVQIETTSFVFHDDLKKTVEVIEKYELYAKEVEKDV